MPSAEPAPTLEPTDLLSRYATRSKHYNTYGITPGAFMPNTKDMRLSVFCTTGLSYEETVAIAEENTPVAYGHGSSLVSFIRSLGLDADYNNDPHRHVDIIGWPEAKDRQKSLAQKLSKEVNSSGNFCRYLEATKPKARL